MRILLIEDNHDLGKGIVDGLLTIGYEVHWEKSGKAGLYQAEHWEWDVVILDRMLPEKEGIAVLQDLRRSKSVPVLMLTALNAPNHRIEGLDGGADDYLGKPFEFAELLARLRAMTRRAYGINNQEIQFQGLLLRSESGQVFRGQEDLMLSSAEFKTLEHLLLRRGSIVSRRRLEDLIAADGGDVLPNTLDVHMHRLRAKIGSGIIQTRRGQGYVIADED